MHRSSLSRLVVLTACLSLSATLVPRVALAEPTAAEQATARAAMESGLSKGALGDPAETLSTSPAPPPDRKPETKGTGMIVGGNILAAHGIPLIIVGITSASTDWSGREEKVPLPAAVVVSVVGIVSVVVGITLLGIGAENRFRSTKAASTRSAWVGAPGGPGWRWQF